MPIIPANNVEIKDEGVSQGRVRGIDFTGTGIAATVAGSLATVNAPGWTLIEVEISLLSAPNARRSGKFSISTSGLTASRHVNIIQVNGPYTGKGTRADEAEMDSINVTGKTTSTTNIDCFWSSIRRVRGNYKFAYRVSDT